VVIESVESQSAAIQWEAAFGWAALRLVEIPPVEPRQAVPLEVGQREGLPAAEHPVPALALAAEATERVVPAEMMSMRSSPRFWLQKRRTLRT
jgi:hypothetical protein